MRVGVFHWSFDFFGGGEQLAIYLARAVGQRKVYTIASVEHPEFEDISHLLPAVVKFVRKYRSFDYLTWSYIDITELGDFDVIITSGATARALITPEDIMHVHYLHAPPRWLYDLWHWRKKRVGAIKRNIYALAAELLRIWDAAVDKRVDRYFANSPITRWRLWKYLKRDAEVLYPPIEFDKYKFKEYGDFYLFISRLEPEKRWVHALAACTALDKKLVVVGVGSQSRLLERYAQKNPNVEYRGFVSEEEKLELLATCRAVIYPAVAEDFGIVPIEALASGKPVICADNGFPPMLIGNKYGIVCDGSAVDIMLAIERLERREWDPEELRAKAKQFDFKNFKWKLWFWLKKWWREFNDS
jgi:glycosyltransferase involved in cell wall biosynthesis